MTAISNIEKTKILRIYKVTNRNGCELIITDIRNHKSPQTDKKNTPKTLCYYTRMTPEYTAE